MNDRYKKLTIELSDVLWTEALQFLANNLENEEETSDIINLVLSAHLTSMCNLMKWTSDDHPHISKRVNEFIEEVLSFIAKIHPIKDMEIIKND